MSAGPNTESKTKANAKDSQAAAPRDHLACY